MSTPGMGMVRDAALERAMGRGLLAVLAADSLHDGVEGFVEL